MHGSGEWQRKIGTALAAAGCLLLIGISLKAQSGSAPPTPSPSKTAEHAYKNIQVLKDVPSDQLIPAMQFMASSLGVQCDFCHMEGSFDNDDKKPKQIARKMMQMMMIINQENFDSHRQVTCFTCHRGSPMPVAVPIVVAGLIPPLPHGLDDEVAAASLPSVDQILDKYMRAIGGLPAIQKMRSRVEHGTMAFGPRQFAVDTFIQAPNKTVTVMHLPNGDNITGSNGQEGWSSAPGRPQREMSSSDLAYARLDADLQFPGDAKKIFKESRVEKEDKVEDKAVFVLLGAVTGQPPMRLYFDEQSGLLVREMRYTESPLGLNPTQIDYSDYREQDGVKIPFRRVTSQPRGGSTIQVEKMEINIPIDDSRFVEPVVTTPPSGSVK